MKLDELAAASGATSAAIRKWRNDGMPKAQTGFDPAACLAWMRANRKTKWADKLAAHLQRGQKHGKPGRPLKPSGDTSGDSLAAAANRARVLEVSLFAEWQAAKDAGQHDVAREIEDRYLAAAEQRRKIEKDLPDGQTKAGEVVPRAEVERLWTGIAAACRDDILAVPVSLAPRLVGRSDVAEIAGLLDDSLRDALRHLADKTEGMK